MVAAVKRLQPGDAVRSGDKRGAVIRVEYRDRYDVRGYRTVVEDVYVDWTR